MAKAAELNAATWGFEALDQARAGRLETAGSSDALVAAIAGSIGAAIEAGAVRLAVDSIGNLFQERRAIVQFRVTPELYDWFFNGRTGYRAQFWIDPAVGVAFNGYLVKSISEAIVTRIPIEVVARRIEVRVDGASRDEQDTGEIVLTRKEILKSLLPEASKIWIGERLYSSHEPVILNIGLPLLMAAERGEKLNIPRWAGAVNPKTGERGEGLRAPLPESETAWLDVKGGFIKTDGSLHQIKPHDRRARQLHERGWT